MKDRIVRNLIGPQVRRLRCTKDWSQEQLMFKLQDLGWNICRQRIARIEACEAWVSDFEMLLIATVFNVEIKDLFPPIKQKEPLYLILSRLLSGQVKTLMSPDDILLDRSARYLLPDGSTISSGTADKSSIKLPVVSSSKRNTVSTDRPATENLNKGSERPPRSISQLAELLGIDELSVYWRIQRLKLDICRAASGRLLLARGDMQKLGIRETEHA